jgi:hypothetical protein
VNAESAYVFGHALLRKAAYQLQLPSGRARLHAMALESIEQTCGGRPPELPPLDATTGSFASSHASDAFALELAEHARLCSFESRQAEALRLAYLRRAAEYAARAFQSEAAADMWRMMAELSAGQEKSEALRRGAGALATAGRPKDAAVLLERVIADDLAAGRTRHRGVALANLAETDLDASRPDRVESLLEERWTCFAVQAIGLSRVARWRRGLA